MMKTLHILTGLILFIAAIPTNVLANVYKCTYFDKNANLHKVVYTDAPCSYLSKQTLTDIKTVTRNTAEDAIEDTKTSDALDMQVTQAVLKRDFKLAKSLASTKEHWRLIAMAEDGAPQPVTVKTTPPVITQNNQQDDCAIARDDYDYTSRVNWRDKDSIATKKSIMHVACGLSEPATQYRPVLIGMPYALGWHGRYHKHYGHYGHQPHHGHHANHGSGLSLSYKSKHVGIQLNSTTTHGAGYSNH